MISEVDIEAWREDEKQTDFLTDRRKAVNHVGWAVERLTDKGWVQLTITFPDYPQTMCHLMNWKTLYPATEFRIYEVLK